MPYILGIDQSTSGTKALIFDQNGDLVGREDRPHQQKISPEGWVSHDPEEIFENLLSAVSAVLERTKIDRNEVCAVGISNQRETAAVWDRKTGKPAADAVVWHCARGMEICRRLEAHKDSIYRRTGLPLSPYFSAAKIAWLLEHTGFKPEELCAGTMDSYLIYRLTGGRSFRTDYSNASRTQLFHLEKLCWDEEICGLFGIPVSILPEVCDSDADFGSTDFQGLLPREVPIHGVLGDSQGALLAQGCHEPGMVKATYGTGSSVMMNIGGKPVFSTHGLVTSLAWGLGGKKCYVLEGNINYTGAAIRWITDLGLISHPKESGKLASQANPEDSTYLVPAFTGLGSPYWDDNAKAAFVGMTRTTGRAELVKAAEDSIAYQIADVLAAMEQDTGIPVSLLRADGGPSRDSYLMQFQSDILQISVETSHTEESSATGPAYAAGIAAGLYSQNVFHKAGGARFVPQMDPAERFRRYKGWKEAVGKVLSPHR